MPFFIEVIVWISCVIFGIGCVFFCWETIMNLTGVPKEKRPSFFGGEAFQKYQTVGIASTMFLPAFGIWKWGWVGIFSYQVYPGACLLLAIILHLMITRQKKPKPSH